MRKIIESFGVNLLNPTRKDSSGVIKTESLKLTIAKIDTIDKLISYFDNFPLFSSKYFNYSDFKLVHTLKKKISKINYRDYPHIHKNS